jgi:hypothetical protein
VVWGLVVGCVWRAVVCWWVCGCVFRVGVVKLCWVCVKYGCVCYCMLVGLLLDGGRVVLLVNGCWWLALICGDIG